MSFKEKRIFHIEDVRAMFMPWRDEIDPKEYGFICPKCTKRYGELPKNKYIYVERCGDCPPLAFRKDYAE
jgi:hypothetical protein